MIRPTIRLERSGDEMAISALTTAAFEKAPHADGNEAEIVERLRADGDLALSLVATNADEAIVGQITFSPVRITTSYGTVTNGWYGLGPVSVIPTNQNTGIGALLIDRGIAEMVARKAKGIVLLGDPAYYARFGFAPDSRLTYSAAAPEYFQTLPLAGDVPTGEVAYAPAFG